MLNRSWLFGLLFPIISQAQSNPVPAPVAPQNNAADQPLKVDLRWRKVANAFAYDLEYSATEQFVAPVQAHLGSAADTSLATGDLDTAKTYWWRIRSLVGTGDSIVAGAWSQPWRFTTSHQAPAGIPVLSAPMQHASAQPSDPVLAWGGVPRATRYRLQVSLSHAFVTLAVDSLSADTTLQLHGLNYGTEYHWRVRAENGAGAGAYSDTGRAFSTLAAPPAPALLAPANADSPTVPINVKFLWGKAALAQSYHLQVANANTFAANNLILDADNLADTLQQVTLDYGTVYYWRVWAKNQAGTSDTPMLRSFKTEPLTAPAKPMLAAPADGAADLALTPTLRWHPSLRAKSYHLQVSTHRNFDAVQFEADDLLDTTKQVNTPLSPNDTVYWHVSAKNAAGVSAYSDSGFFTTATNALAEPVQASPKDSARNLPMPAALVWNKVAGATGYHLLVADNYNFLNPVISSDLTDTAKTLDSLAKGSTYYWRVRARNPVANGPYTDIHVFFTAPPIPAKPALSRPANQAADVRVPVTLKWGSVAGAASYHVQVASDSGFSALVADDSILTDTTFRLPALGADSTFYWRVLAKNGGGSGAYSDTWRFKIQASTQLAAVAWGAPAFRVLPGSSVASGMNLAFSLPSRSNVKVTLYGLADGRSWVLVNREMDAGAHRLSALRGPTAGGVYALRINSEKLDIVQRIFLP